MAQDEEQPRKSVGVYDRPESADRPRSRWVLILVMLLAIIISIWLAMRYFG